LELEVGPQEQRLDCLQQGLATSLVAAAKFEQLVVGSVLE
jgi:hypothetical protein